MKLRKRDVPKAACKQTVHAKRRGEMFAITTTRKPLRGPVTSFVPSWLRLATELTLWPCRPPLAEAKRLKSALRNVASVGLSVQVTSPPVAEERVTVHTTVFQFLLQLFLTSQVVQQLYLIL